MIQILQITMINFLFLFLLSITVISDGKDLRNEVGEAVIKLGWSQWDLGMAMRMRKMRIHADDAHIYKANKRIYADADAMRMMRIAKNCRMAIPN